MDFSSRCLNRLGGAWAASRVCCCSCGNDVDLGAPLCSGFCMAPRPIDILTGGSMPPYSINLRLGLAEADLRLQRQSGRADWRGLLRARNIRRMLLYLLLVMGIQGMVMTRDLFNLFVFLEIVSIATYGLLSLQDTPAALSATFKYLMATVLASTFFLIGTVLLYAATGILNIDDLIANARRSPVRSALPR